MSHIASKVEKYISIDKVTENVRKFLNLGAKFWKNNISKSRWRPKILRKGVFLSLSYH